MNWESMRFFLAVCRHGSVTGAGKALGVTHTTVARRIAALEEDLGSRLFDRSRDGYEMTRSAKEVFKRVVDVEAQMIDIERSILGKDAALAGPLRLTLPQQIAEVIVAPTLAALSERYPRIDLQLVTTANLLDLNAREADLALRITRQPPEYLVGRRVVPLAQGPYASAGYLASHEGPHRVIVYQDLRGATWVHDHLPGATVALRTDSIGTMRAAVACGLGIGWLPCYYADLDPSLRRLDLDLPETDWGLWILNHVDLRGTARVRAVREHLIEAIEAQHGLLSGGRSRFASLSCR